MHEIINKLPERLDEIEDMLTHNRIFAQRTKGIGIASAHQALKRGYS